MAERQHATFSANEEPNDKNHMSDDQQNECVVVIVRIAISLG